MRRFLILAPSVVHVKGSEVDLQQPLPVVEVADPPRDGGRLVVGPVVVLGVDRRLPDVPLGAVERGQLVVVLAVVEDVVDVLLPGRAGHHGRPVR